MNLTLNANIVIKTNSRVSPDNRGIRQYPDLEIHLTAKKRTQINTNLNLNTNTSTKINMNISRAANINIYRSINTKTTVMHIVRSV